MVQLKDHYPGDIAGIQPLIPLKVQETKFLNLRLIIILLARHHILPTHFLDLAAIAIRHSVLVLFESLHHIRRGAQLLKTTNIMRVYIRVRQPQPPYLGQWNRRQK